MLMRIGIWMVVSFQFLDFPLGICSILLVPTKLDCKFCNPLDDLLVIILWHDPRVFKEGVPQIYLCQKRLF